MNEIGLCADITNEVRKAIAPNPIMHTWTSPEWPQNKLQRPTNVLTNEVPTYKSWRSWSEQIVRSTIKRHGFIFNWPRRSMWARWLHFLKPCGRSATATICGLHRPFSNTINRNAKTFRTLLSKKSSKSFCIKVYEQLGTTQRNAWGLWMTLMISNRRSRGFLCESGPTLTDKLSFAQSRECIRRPLIKYQWKSCTNAEKG